MDFFYSLQSVFSLLTHISISSRFRAQIRHLQGDLNLTQAIKFFVYAKCYVIFEFHRVKRLTVRSCQQVGCS